MTRVWRIITIATLAALAFTSVAISDNLTDPYEILNKYFDAIGGIFVAVLGHRHPLEGTIAVAGLEGTIKFWTAKPGLSRAEVDLGVLKMTQGDNGEYSWVFDSNGKVQKTTNPDELAVQRRDIRIRLSDQEYADPNSEIFTVTFGGIDTANGNDCYAIKISTNINADVFTYYVNTETFLLEKTISQMGDKSQTTWWGDYREVDGLTVAFSIREIVHLTGQAQTTTLSSYISNPQIDPSVFDPPEEGAKDFHFVTGNSAENIPFRLIGNHLYIKVMVGCKERWWILDTGASMSVIHNGFADSLGLELHGDIKGRGAGGVVNVNLAILPPLSLPGIEFAEQNVAVIDMNDLIQVLGVDIAGILGFDFLSRFVTKVNYANELVSFYDPETFVYAGDGKSLDVHMVENVFMAQATLDGVHSGPWLFDLGAGTTSLDGAFALRQGYTEKKGVEGIGHGAANAFRTKVVKAGKIEFAGFTVDNPRISFSYGGTDTTHRADRIGILGNSLFRNFVLYVDYTRERVILEKGTQFNFQFPVNNSGLQLTRDTENNVVVLFASPGSPADKAGFLEGDILKSINGIEIEYLDGIVAVRELLTKDPGTEYTVVINRDEQDRELALTLANLY